jgi:hypothetical protein
VRRDFPARWCQVSIRRSTPLRRVNLSPASLSQSHSNSLSTIHARIVRHITGWVFLKLTTRKKSAKKTFRTEIFLRFQQSKSFFSLYSEPIEGLFPIPAPQHFNRLTIWMVAETLLLYRPTSKETVSWLPTSCTPSGTIYFGIGSDVGIDRKFVVAAAKVDATLDSVISFQRYDEYIAVMPVVRNNLYVIEPRVSCSTSRQKHFSFLTDFSSPSRLPVFCESAYFFTSTAVGYVPIRVTHRSAAGTYLLWNSQHPLMELMFSLPAMTPPSIHFIKDLMLFTIENAYVSYVALANTSRSTFPTVFTAANTYANSTDFIFRRQFITETYISQTGGIEYSVFDYQTIGITQLVVSVQTTGAVFTANSPGSRFIGAFGLTSFSPADLQPYSNLRATLPVANNRTILRVSDRGPTTVFGTVSFDVVTGNVVPSSLRITAATTIPNTYYIVGAADSFYLLSFYNSLIIPLHADAFTYSARFPRGSESSTSVCLGSVFFTTVAANGTAYLAKVGGRSDNATVFLADLGPTFPDHSFPFPLVVPIGGRCYVAFFHATNGWAIGIDRNGTFDTLTYVTEARYAFPGAFVAMSSEPFETIDGGGIFTHLEIRRDEDCSTYGRGMIWRSPSDYSLLPSTPGVSNEQTVDYISLPKHSLNGMMTFARGDGEEEYLFDFTPGAASNTTIRVTDVPLNASLVFGQSIVSFRGGQDCQVVSGSGIGSVLACWPHNLIEQAYTAINFTSFGPPFSTDGFYIKQRLADGAIIAAGTSFMWIVRNRLIEPTSFTASISRVTSQTSAWAGSSSFLPKALSLIRSEF